MGDERQYLCWDGVIRVQSEQRPPAKGEWWTWPENCPSAVQASTDYREIDPDGDYIILEPFNANGPQRSDSGAPNPDSDVVTVELTREEAENLEMSVTHGLSHTPSNPPDRRDLYCPTCRALASLRASLERTSK